VGPIQAATLIAAIGNIDNFPSAAALKAYFGWAPTMVQTGSTLDQVTLGRGGSRTTKQTMFLIVGNAIQMNCEWKRIYDRLVPIKCSYDERVVSLSILDEQRGSNQPFAALQSNNQYNRALSPALVNGIFSCLIAGC
jgi:Transposase IS116/IS110/IS902 family